MRVASGAGGQRPPTLTIVASGNGASALPVGMRLLRRGGNALDAVEACARIVEADPTDTSVGRGGKPNVLGIVELDASIVDGTTHRVGAVAALVGYLYPITIARAVMEHTPHVMLVGAGNYCDTRYGAAACTGFGELAIRNVTAKTAVDRLAKGIAPVEVARLAVADANVLDDAAFNIVVLAADGTHASATNREGRRYCFMTADMEEPVTTAREVVR